jgi:hypothetical protein
VRVPLPGRTRVPLPGRARVRLPGRVRMEALACFETICSRRR